MYRHTLQTSQGKVSFLFREGTKYLILLHGLGGIGNNFMKISSCIPEDYGIVLPDLLGHGQSARPNNITITNQADMIHELIGAMDIKEFFIGGNSYGGWVALSYEVKYADSQGLILIDNAGTNPTVGDQGEESVEKFMSRIERVSPKNDMKIMRQIVENNTGSKYKIDAEKLRKIGKRSLIIWGKEDQMIPVEYGIRANENMQNSKLVIIENGTHTPHVSSNEKVCESIVDYLNGK